MSELQTGTHTVQFFAPTGTLHAAINLGNPILANRDTGTGKVFGISVDLANDFARVLDVPLALVVVDSARKSVDAVKQGHADIGFFAVDPLRGQDIAFTSPYIQIEGTYLVENSSPIQTIEEVDQPHVKVAVGEGSAYDLYLSRELKHAQIVRAPTSPEVVDYFLDQKLDVAAGVKQQLEADAQRLGGLRLLAGRFMLIRQAMGISRTRPEAAAQFLSAFIESRKQNGFIRQAMELHNIQGSF